MAALAVRIVGRQLPGRRFAAWGNVHVGMQRGPDVVDMLPGDAPEAIFQVMIDVVTDAQGQIDFRGPFVHGKRGERFLYLSWGQLTAEGQFQMFRRAKLHLSALNPQEVAQALATNAVIVGTLSLTDERAAPRSASIRPPTITWQVAPERQQA